MDLAPTNNSQYGTAPGMPMHTEGKTTGATVKAEIDLAARGLPPGGEYQHYTLNDWWLASGTGGMSPYTFININDGQRIAAWRCLAGNHSSPYQWTGPWLGACYGR